MKLLLLLLLCHTSSSVKHTLISYLTASDGDKSLTDSFLMELDGNQVDYIDISEHRLYSSLWKTVIDTHPFMWCNEDVVKDLLYTVKAAMQEIKKLSQSEGVQTFQCMAGCEWDETTGDVVSFDRCGFNGENFMKLDLKNLEWIPQHLIAEAMKPQLNANQQGIKHYEHFVTLTCPDWLKLYVAKSPSQRDPPSVSLLQKTSSSPVTCHAAGFYPNRALMFWTRDGEEIHEDVEHGEILPNNDGTFQMSVDLNVASVPPEDWRRYDCVFQFSGAENKKTTRLEQAAIRSNSVPPSEFPVGAVVGVVGLVLLVFCLTGLFMWRKKRDGFRPANTSDPQKSNPNNQSSMSKLENDDESQ